VITLGHVQLRFVAPGEDFVYSPDRPKPEASPTTKKSPLMFAVGGLVGAGVLTGIYFGVVRKPPPVQNLDNPTVVAAAPPPSLIPAASKPAAAPAAAVPPAVAAPTAPAQLPKPQDSAPDDEIKIPDSAVAQADAIPPRNHRGTSESPANAKPSSRKEKGRDAAESKEKRVASAAALPDAAKKDTDDLRSQAEKSMADGDYDSAISKLRKVLKLDPNDALGHKLMGSCLASEGNLDEAAAHYRRFVSLAPNDPQAPEIKQILDSFEKNSNKP
jgi:hypothetical protein